MQTRSIYHRYSYFGLLLATLTLAQGCASHVPGCGTCFQPTSSHFSAASSIMFPAQEAYCHCGDASNGAVVLPGLRISWSSHHGEHCGEPPSTAADPESGASAILTPLTPDLSLTESDSDYGNIPSPPETSKHIFQEDNQDIGSSRRSITQDDSLPLNTTQPVEHHSTPERSQPATSEVSKAEGDALDPKPEPGSAFQVPVIPASSERRADAPEDGRTSPPGSVGDPNEPANLDDEDFPLPPPKSQPVPTPPTVVDPAKERVAHQEKPVVLKAVPRVEEISNSLDGEDSKPIGAFVQTSQEEAGEVASSDDSESSNVAHDWPLSLRAESSVQRQLDDLQTQLDAIHSTLLANEQRVNDMCQPIRDSRAEIELPSFRRYLTDSPQRVARVPDVRPTNVQRMLRLRAKTPASNEQPILRLKQTEPEIEYVPQVLPARSAPAENAPNRVNIHKYLTKLKNGQLR